MSVEELIDFCKLQFEDFKFIDTIIRFCKINEDSENKQNIKEEENKIENSFTVYISQDKVQTMNEII